MVYKITVLSLGIRYFTEAMVWNKYLNVIRQWLAIPSFSFPISFLNGPQCHQLFTTHTIKKIYMELILARQKEHL
jgi:hypothetical protein